MAPPFSSSDYTTKITTSSGGALTENSVSSSNIINGTITSDDLATSLLNRIKIFINRIKKQCNECGGLYEGDMCECSGMYEGETCEQCGEMKEGETELHH